MPKEILSKKERLKLRKEVLEKCLIESHESFVLKNHDTKWAGPKKIQKHWSEKEIRKAAKKQLKKNLDYLSEAQELLYASNKHSLLLIFQAMDAAGKDGTIKHVMTGVNPQGCHVSSFKKPSAKELEHNFLWRYMKQMPERGMIGIFNRSYYEEVLVVKVHPKFLEPQLLPGNVGSEEFWNSRYEDINNMEKHLTHNGTVILKFFLNVSKAEQKRRFMERLDNPEKHWKFSENDLVERGYWDDYMNAFETAINATSTEWAPWFVIPADYKWGMRTIVSQIITETILSLDLEFPEVSPEKEKRLQEARTHLLAEDD